MFLTEIVADLFWAFANDENKNTISKPLKTDCLLFTISY
ncbi:hypothetical protein RCH33_991 [Flavobacterium daejeonense]|nr:hypothetical protein RCH33_991 [Flavobacterium daejeonense]